MLYFVRHGSTYMNAGDPADPRDYYRGWVDVQLSDFGKQAGQQTAEWFRGKEIDLIVSSPLNRARETMEMLLKTTGEPNWRLDARLLPWNIGVFTGELITPENRKVLDDLERRRPWQQVPMGESYSEYLERYTPGLKEWLAKAKDMNIIIVAHHRNALALPVIFKSTPPSLDGPPGPGGVLKIDQRGNFRVLFEPEKPPTTPQGVAS
jgi:broad specificity phosphatase PhoE